MESMPGPRHHRRIIHAAVVAALALCAACGSPTEVRTDPRACHQTYEFGNTGCADIEGVVTDAGNDGVPGVYVGTRPRSGRAVIGSGYATTDAAGHFRLRVTRHAGQPPATGPDTLSLYVQAVDPRSAGLDTPATVRDSVLTRVTIVPVGAVPEAVVVALRLDLP